MSGDTTPHLLTTAEVAGIVGVSVATAARWRARGLGPRWVRLDLGTVRYDPAEVARWIASHRRPEPEEGQ